MARQDLLKAASEGLCGNIQCHPRTEFCDPYETSCHGCADLCSVEAKFNECAERCKPYLQDMLTFGKTNGATPDLKSLQILLGIVIAITFTVLILLVVLLALKLRSGRKKIGSRNFHNESISMAQVSPTHQISNGIQPEMVRGSLVTAPSMQTVSTHLSSIRSRPSGGRQQSRQTPSPSSGNVTSTNRERSTTSRIPTEDRVPETHRNSYDNPGLDLSSPTTGSSPQRTSPGTKDHLPPVRSNGHPGPFTISHSNMI